MRQCTSANGTCSGNICVRDMHFLILNLFFIFHFYSFIKIIINLLILKNFSITFHLGLIF